MDVTVFGASGGIGSRVVALGSERGDHVRAVVRSAASGVVLEGLTGVDVVIADVMDTTAIEPLVAGADAVITAIGIRPGQGNPSVATDGARSIVTAMQSTGTRRILLVSASGAYREPGDDALTRWIAKPIVRRVLARQFVDVRAADDIVMASGLDWTVVRPSRLIDDPGAQYRTAIDRGLPGGWYSRRADVADFLLRAVTDVATVGHTVSVAR